MNMKKTNENKLRRLASRLKLDLKTTVCLYEQVIEFADNIPLNDVNISNPNLYAVALSLQHFYTSLETILKRIIKELEGDIPDGESWHKELLDMSVVEVEKIRPEIISKDILVKLDRLRRFRHVVRHGYEYELDWEQMQPLVSSLDDIISVLKDDIKDFIDYLLTVAEEMEEK